MTKDDWYADRITWRAGQHGLLEKQCSRYEELGESEKRTITNATDLTGRPILVFYKSETVWTILTTREIASFVDGRVNVAPLDQIKKSVKVVQPAGAVSSTDIKRTADRLFLVKPNIEVWAPQGQALFALMNILQMFPLSQPGKTT